MSSQPRLTMIGLIHSPFKEPAGTPIQPSFAEGREGIVEVFPEYADGLQDLDGFERIWLLYWFDRAPCPRLRVVPFRDEVQRGLFATRMSCRPNPIGLSCVRLLRIQGHTVSERFHGKADWDILATVKARFPAATSSILMPPSR